MEEISSNTATRKRKEFSSSAALKQHFMGPIARGKYRRPFRKNFQQSQSVPVSSPKKPKSMHCPELENRASLDLSIKDLRARARRIFSPTCGVEGKNGNCEVGFDFGEEICNGSSKILENGGDFELGFKGSDPGYGSGSGFCVFNEEGKEKSLKGGSIDPGSKDLDPGLGNQGPSDEKDVGTDKINQVESGNDRSEIRRNVSISSTKVVQKSCSRGKVYKSPSLFSYRRLLPFLTDMAKDDSCTKRSKIVDEDCKVKDSVLIDSKFAEHDNIAEDSNGTKPSDKVPFKEVETQLEVIGQELLDSGGGLPQNGYARSSNVEERNHEIGLTGDDESIEECIQTTPPDSTILSELDILDTHANVEVNSLKTENPVFSCPSNGSTCSKNISVLKKAHTSPTRRNNTISTTKLVLNPCSRSKIYKTSSSFSYRRLLPLLMDVAKSSSNNDSSSKFQKDVSSSLPSASMASLENGMLLNQKEAFNIQERQGKSQEQNFLTNIKVPSIDGSSDGICEKLSATSSSSSKDISAGNSNSSCFENISKPETNSLPMERISLHGHAELNKPEKFDGELHVADIRVCDAEDNSLSETSGSTESHISLPIESKLQVSLNQSADIGKNCYPKAQVYPKDKVYRIKNVTLDQCSSQVGDFYHQETGSPTKGIQKRNPRGCRGLCSCLNCSSFRLHAERAFEFSRNQMLDAEEITLTLINKLAKLRDMLEKAALDGSDMTATHHNQLRESCDEALALEQRAKQRLIQMNYDLNVHCRITPLERPRVTFSRCTEVTELYKSL